MLTRQIFVCRPATLISLLAMIVCGCTTYRPPFNLAQRPHVIHLPGVSGDNPVERGYLAALANGGLAADYELIDWTPRNFFLINLTSYDANHAAARRIADRIASLYRHDARRPIVLTCDSAGAGPAVWALEDLPADVKVEGLVMLSPALSPEYDLSNALQHVQTRCVTLWSPGDWLVLGLGTQAFGTVDGVHTSAAGLVGFAIPPSAADPGQYQKVRQLRYDPSWWSMYGNSGDHTGPMAPCFASGYLAPAIAELVSAQSSRGSGSRAQAKPTLTAGSL